MNIYLLTRECAGYDEYYEKVVISENEDSARKLANMNTGAEGDQWLDKDYVTCKLIDINISEEVLSESFNAG